MTTAEIIEQLRQSFELIRDERNLYANTATRIGNAFLSLLELFSNVSGLADQFKDIFLSSKENDIAEGIITFLNGLKVGKTGNYGFDGNGDAELHDINGNKVTVVEAVVSGLLRATSAVINSLVSGNITTQSLTVTGAAHFFSLIIDELRSVGGSVILTAANANVDNVEEVSAGIYRLSWRATDGEKKIYNQFIPGDGVICMTFNASEASGTAVSNKYYWMRCTEAGTMTVEEKLYNYILLDSSVGSALNNAIPEAGDKIVQLGYSGSASDAAQRQSAIILAAYNSPDAGLEAPMFAHYTGISDFELSEHRHTHVSLAGSKFIGEFVVKTTNDDGQTVYVDIVDMLNGLVVDMEAIKQQTDGMMVIYFSYGAPSKSSAPASGWAEADYPRHVGDLYYDKYTSSTTYGHAWQWSLESGIYDWKEITDKHTIAALQAAAAAQATADSKIRCFFVQPYGPYDTGDIWIRENGEVWQCITAETAANAFNIAHWALKVNTEDLKNFYEKLYNVNPDAFEQAATSPGYIDVNVGTTTNVSRHNFFYNTSTGKLYHGRLSDDVTTIEEVTDAAAIEAVVNSLGTYDYSNRRRIWLATPSSQYYKGEIWIKKYHVYNGLDNTALAAGSDIYVCTNTNSIYSSSDWLRVTNSGASEFKVLRDQIRALVYDSEGSSLMELTSKAITMINSAFDFDKDGNITGVKISGLLTEDGATTLFANYLRNNNYVKGSDLNIAVDGIAATVRGQNVYPNLFGFSDGLTFDGTCVPFIQAYGVEFVGSGNGYIRFGGKSVNGVTISFSAKAVGAETNVNFYINGNTGVTTKAIDTDWTDITLNVPSVTSLGYLRAYYSNADVTTVVLKNIKVESGNIATDFCISDADSSIVSNTNLFTTTVDYNRDPIYMKINANETMDTLDADGHGNVLTFYRNNSSDPPFLLYNDYIGWGDDPRTKLFTAGKVYTISFWAKAGVSGLKIHTGLYGHVTTAGESSTASYTTHNSGAYYSDKLTDGVYDNGGCECIHSLSTSWKRYYARFYIQTGVTAIPIIQCNNGLPLGSEDSVYLYIADVRLEEGYISDDSQKLSDKANSMAQIRMSADSINLEVSDKLQRTGIDIEKKKIKLDAENTIVTGSFAAKKVNTTDIGVGHITMEGGLMQVFNPDNVLQITFGADASGNILLRYYNQDGTIAWDLGPEGIAKSASQGEEVRTMRFCRMCHWNGSSWEPVSFWEDSTISDFENYKYKNNGSSKSYLAYLLDQDNLPQNGSAYYYYAKINEGQYVGGEGRLAASNYQAKCFDRHFIASDPSTSNQLDGATWDSNRNIGDISGASQWRSHFLYVTSVGRWYSVLGVDVTYNEQKKKYYSFPQDLDPMVGIDEELFEVDYNPNEINQYYKRPFAYFRVSVVEDGLYTMQNVLYCIALDEIEGL